MCCLIAKNCSSVRAMEAALTCMVSFIPNMFILLGLIEARVGLLLVRLSTEVDGRLTSLVFVFNEPYLSPFNHFSIFNLHPQENSNHRKASYSSCPTFPFLGLSFERVAASSNWSPSLHFVKTSWWNAMSALPLCATVRAAQSAKSRDYQSPFEKALRPTRRLFFNSNYPLTSFFFSSHPSLLHTKHGVYFLLSSLRIALQWWLVCTCEPQLSATKVKLVLGPVVLKQVGHQGLLLTSLPTKASHSYDEWWALP